MSRNTANTSDVVVLDEDDDEEEEVVELVPCDDCGHLVPPTNMEMHRLRGCPNRKQRPNSSTGRRRRHNESDSSDDARSAEWASPSRVLGSGSYYHTTSDGLRRQRSSSEPEEELVLVDENDVDEDDVDVDDARDPPQNPGFVEQQLPVRQASRASRPVVQGRNVHDDQLVGSPFASAAASAPVTTTTTTTSPSSPWERFASTITSAVCGVPTATAVPDGEPSGSAVRERGTSAHRYPASRRNRPRPKSPPPAQPRAEVINVLDSPPPVATAATRASSRQDGSYVDMMDSDVDDLPSSEDDGWACPRCTLQNPRSRTVCEACMYLLPRQHRSAVRPPDATRREALLPSVHPYAVANDAEEDGGSGVDAAFLRRGRSYPPSQSPSSSAARSSSYVGSGAILGGVLGAASSYVRGRPVARGALDGAVGGAMGGLAVDAVVQQQQQQERQRELLALLAQQESRRQRELRRVTELSPELYQSQRPSHRSGGGSNGTSRTFRIGNGSITVSTGRSIAMNPMMMDMLLQQSMMANMMGQGGLGGGQGGPTGGGGGGMNYEQLLHMFGDGTENLGAADHQIEALPTSTVTSRDNNKGQCSICLQEFGVGDSFKTLPCLHCDFHTSCIDQWLKTNAVCPVCKHRLE